MYEGSVTLASFHDQTPLPQHGRSMTQLSRAASDTLRSGTQLLHAARLGAVWHNVTRVWRLPALPAHDFTLGAGVRTGSIGEG